MEDVIINKVTNSGLMTVNLEKYYPEGEMAHFDLKDYLFMGLILKEKDFRESLKNLDWSVFAAKNVALFCSADAIIPRWAYMLVTSYLQPYARQIVFGDEQRMLTDIFLKNVSEIDTRQFAGKKVVVKGCGDKKVPEAVYVKITTLLRPVARSIMYGEACSTVPIFKQK